MDEPHSPTQKIAPINNLQIKTLSQVKDMNYKIQEDLFGSRSPPSENIEKHFRVIEESTKCVGSKPISMFKRQSTKRSDFSSKNEMGKSEHSQSIASSNDMKAERA